MGSGETILRVIRILFFAVITGATTYDITNEWGFSFIIDMKTWGSITCSIYCLISIFKLAVNSECHDYLLQILWSFIWSFSFTYWFFIIDLRDESKVLQLLVIDSILLTYTIFEFTLNPLPFERKNYIIPLGFILFYMFFVLAMLSCLYQPIYPGFSFMDLGSYLYATASIITAMLSLELGRLLKTFMNSQSPCESVSFFTSSQFKEDLLLATRIFSFLSVSFYFVFFAIYSQELIYFTYFTNWGLCLTSIYFFISLLSYKLNVGTAQLYFFLIVWVFNWDITLAYWGYLFPHNGINSLFRSMLNHLVPLLLIFVELAQVRFAIKRTNYLIPLLSLVVYLVFVLVPVTVFYKEIYSGISFKNYFSYAICFGLILLGGLMLEIAKFLMHLKNRKRSIENEEVLINKL